MGRWGKGVLSKLKIVTVNVPESYIETIKKLVGPDGLYPSRSELIRVAVREFLIKEIKMAKNIINEPDEDLDEKNFVRVPIDRVNGEFKTYKIIKRLEY